MSTEKQKTDITNPEAGNKNPQKDAAEKAKDLPEEKGGRGGLEPVRYGDWEIGGKCVDF